MAPGSSLHPAQCRLPGPAGPGSQHPGRQPCGQRLDEHRADGPGPGQLPPGALALQQHLLAMLADTGYPAGDAAAYFTDLRVITAMLCLTWPASGDLTGLSAPALISRHVSELGTGYRPVADRPPRHPLAAAGLPATVSPPATAPIPLLAVMVTASRTQFMILVPTTSKCQLS